MPDVPFLSPAPVKTGNYTALDGDFVPVDTTSGNVTVTLPANPPDGAIAAVKLVKQGSGNTVTINAAGPDAFNDGGGTSMSLKILNQAVMLQYTAPAGVWYVLANDVPPSSVWPLAPWQFTVAQYGAAGNGACIGDASMSSSVNTTTLTTVGIAAPSAPSVSNAGTGGTIAAGVYQVKITYVNANGETTASGSTSTTTSGTTSTITVTSPAATSATGNATGWYAYVTQAGGSTYYRQQTAGQPTQIGTDLKLTAPPTTSGANPPGGNTTASAPFTSADAGKTIIVNNASLVSAKVCPLVTTISSVTNSSTIVLAAACTNTVSPTVASWATDDTAAFQGAVNAATTYAQAHANYAEVVVPPAPGGLFYGIFGSLVTGSPTFGNAQITLPVIPTTVPKVTLKIRGTYGAALAHWQQNLPNFTGTCLVSGGAFTTAAGQTNSINANGNACLIGGPAQPAGYGTSPALNFSNMCVVLDGVKLFTPYVPNGWNYSAFDFSGVAEAHLSDGGHDVLTTYDLTWITGSNITNLANGVSFGGLMPANSNNDLCVIRNWSAGGGYTYAQLFTEHCVDAGGIRITYCWAAVCVSGGYNGSAGATHAFDFGQVSAEGVTNHVYIFGTGAGANGPIINVRQLDTESSAPTVSDNNNSGLLNALGTINFTGQYTQSGVGTPRKTGLMVISGRQASGPVTALTITAGTPLQNTYWRWANVLLAGGATCTNVKIGTAQGTGGSATMTTIYSQAAAALPVMTVRVPPGGWLEVDGDVPGTNSWVLD